MPEHNDETVKEPALIGSYLVARIIGGNDPTIVENDTYDFTPVDLKNGKQPITQEGIRRDLVMLGKSLEEQHLIRNTANDIKDYYAAAYANYLKEKESETNN